MTIKNKLLAVTALAIMTVGAQAETYVNVYEMPYGAVDQKSDDYKGLYKETVKSAPVSSYKMNSDGKKESYMGKRGVRTTFDESKTSKSNFNALLEIAARYAKTKLKSENSQALSSMLLDLREK